MSSVAPVVLNSGAASVGRLSRAGAMVCDSGDAAFGVVGTCVCLPSVAAGARPALPSSAGLAAPRVVGSVRRCTGVAPADVLVNDPDRGGWFVCTGVLRSPVADGVAAVPSDAARGGAEWASSAESGAGGVEPPARRPGSPGVATGGRDAVEGEGVIVGGVALTPVPRPGRAGSAAGELGAAAGMGLTTDVEALRARPERAAAAAAAVGGAADGVPVGAGEGPGRVTGTTP